MYYIYVGKIFLLQKFYVCKVSGCTKRYIDFSFFRKYVKIVYGLEFYVNKKYKGDGTCKQERREEGDQVSGGLCCD